MVVSSFISSAGPCPFLLSCEQEKKKKKKIHHHHHNTPSCVPIPQCHCLGMALHQRPWAPLSLQDLRREVGTGQGTWLGEDTGWQGCLCCPPLPPAP